MLYLEELKVAVEKYNNAQTDLHTFAAQHGEDYLRGPNPDARSVVIRFNEAQINLMQIVSKIDLSGTKPALAAVRMDPEQLAHDLLQIFLVSFQNHGFLDPTKVEDPTTLMMASGDAKVAVMQKLKEAK